MILKFLQKDTILYILYYSSDEKHDGEIAKPVWPTVLKIGLCSVQEGGLELPKMVLARLFQRIQIRWLQKTPNHRLDQTGWFWENGRKNVQL